MGFTPFFGSRSADVAGVLAIKKGTKDQQGDDSGLDLFGPAWAVRRDIAVPQPVHEIPPGPGGNWGRVCRSSISGRRSGSKVGLGYLAALACSG